MVLGTFSCPKYKEVTMEGKVEKVEIGKLKKKERKKKEKKK